MFARDYQEMKTLNCRSVSFKVMNQFQQFVFSVSRRNKGEWIRSGKFPFQYGKRRE